MPTARSTGTSNVWRVPGAGRLRLSVTKGGIWLEYHRAFAPDAREQCILPPTLAREVATALMEFAEACDDATPVDGGRDVPHL